MTNFTIKTKKELEKFIELCSGTNVAKDVTCGSKILQPAVATCGSSFDKQGHQVLKPVVATCGSSFETCGTTGSGKVPGYKKGLDYFDETDIKLVEGIQSGMSHSRLAKHIEKDRKTVAQHIDKLTNAGVILTKGRSHPGAKRYYLLTAEAPQILSNATAQRSTLPEKERIDQHDKGAVDNDIPASKTTGLYDQNQLGSVFKGRHNLGFVGQILSGSPPKDGHRIQMTGWEQYQYLDKNGIWDIRVNHGIEPTITITLHIQSEGTIEEQIKHHEKYAKILLAEFCLEHNITVSDLEINRESHNELNDVIAKPLGSLLPNGEFRSPHIRKDNTPTPNTVEILGNQAAKNIEWAVIEMPTWAGEVTKLLNSQSEAIQDHKEAINNLTIKIAEQISSPRKRNIKEKKEKSIMYG